MSVLYLTHNALTEPLGRRQVLPYILELAKRGWRYHIVSFEKDETADPAAVARVRELLSSHDIRWTPRRFHHRLLAKPYDLLAGLSVGLRDRSSIQLIHARSTVPAMMASVLGPLLGVPWIFDVRGLLAQEYADGGHWPAGGWLYRSTNALEKRLFRRADGLVFLTERIRTELTERGWLSAATPTTVVPCCVDLDIFRADATRRPDTRKRLGLSDEPLLVYAGSLGSWYRIDEMLAFYRLARARIPALRLLLLTPHIEAAREACTRAALDDDDVLIQSARPDEVPEILAAADAGICFLSDDPSKRASSPTKFGEYLASGLLVIANSWTGDAARFRDEPAWIGVEGFDEASLQKAVDALAVRLARRERSEISRELAEREFALKTAINRYDALYRQLVGGVS